MGAFRRAIDIGADMLETDSRRTLDGVLVAFHDPKLADGRKISALRYDQLPPLADGQPIPRITDIARLASESRVGLVVEPKSRGHELQLVQELSSVLPAERFEIISFNPGSIAAVRAAGGDVRTGSIAPRIPGFLRESALYSGAAWVLDKLDWQPAVNRATRLGAEYVSVDHRLATPRFLRAAAARGVDVDVWTVNDEQVMRRLLDAGVRGIVTDRPDLALKLRDQMAGARALAARSRGAA